MKQTMKRLIFCILALITVAVAAITVYFYVSMSGNPVDRFRQQRALIQVYETRYQEDFVVVSSRYDVKRKEFSYRLSSTNKPDIEFISTLAETRLIDRYAEAQCINYLYQIISEALGKDFDELNYRVNILEGYDSPGLLEPDRTIRLSQNQYVADISWDPPVLDALQVDAILADMTLRISAKLDTPIGGIRLRAGVFDGKNYYTPEIDLR